MSKKKKLKEEPEVKPFEITSAKIKDDYCEYSFDVKKGIGAGDTHTVKGRGIVDPDMHDAFAKFNAHFAYIDDVFHNNNIDVTNIDLLHDHELTERYSVNAFKIKGSEENEAIILIGSKHVVQVMGRIELVAPKIELVNSSYRWYNELKLAADNARKEVELYREGKCTMPTEEDPNQTSIEFGSEKNFEEEFSNAKQ